MNKLELWHIVYIMQQITKPSNLHLIDRLQFPWLTASIGLASNAALSFKRMHFVRQQSETKH